MRKGWSRRTFIGGLASAGALPGATSAQAPARSGRERLYPRGARVPPNLAQRSQAQGGSAAELDQILRSSQRFMRAFAESRLQAAPVESTLPPKFDWREFNRITPIKNQGSCGSCWVFGANAAYESAYLIAHAQDAVRNGVASIDVSEQQGLDCTFPEFDCGGGFHEAVLLYLLVRGQVGSAEYPYSAEKRVCRTDLPARSYYLVNWNYVADEGSPEPFVVPSDTALKEAVHKYGAVVTAIATGGWGYYYRTYDDGSPNPDWPANGVFEGARNEHLSACNIDHEVAIVGWDDEEGVWIIRNSWGPDWGENGYMKLRYGTHLAGYGSSWCAVAPRNAVSATLANQLRNANENNALRTLYPSF
jgi:C1A family cysteine protease